MIDDKTLDSILFLSRLTVSSEEKELFRSQVGSILEYFDLLQEYNTEEVDPDLGNSAALDDLRPDAPGVQAADVTQAQGFSPDEVSSFAIHFKDGYFSVPKILDDFLEHKEEE